MFTPITLDQLARGQKATVKKVGGKGSIRRRLLDMGVTKRRHWATRSNTSCAAITSPCAPLKPG